MIASPASLCPFVCLLSLLGFTTLSVAQKGPSMHAKGTFEVKLTREAVPGIPTISRMMLDKTFHGDLAGTSKGEMLGAGDPQKGNAGYVALEHFTGTLNGRSGSFALQHSGTMDGGALHLNVNVVPGSGTDDLQGISGSMQIIIAAGKHSYEFDYTLPHSAAK